MPSKPLEPGDPVRLGRFELLGRLGAGGQGVVYLGQGNGSEEERVAVKVLRSSADALSMERLARELEAVHQVQPFVTARVIEATTDGDVRYVVSEFIDGPSLQERVDTKGPLAEGELLRLAVGTATALTAIHGAGVVHRDFKPGNVLLGPDGPRVVDFGIARLTDVATITTHGVIIGTPTYIAPEQLAGARPTSAVDIFAWAATMIYAATGRTAFGADTAVAVMYRVMNSEPDLTGVPASLLPLLRHCLAKDPLRRPTARDVLLGIVDPSARQSPAAAPWAVGGAGVGSGGAASLGTVGVGALGTVGVGGLGAVGIGGDGPATTQPAPLGATAVRGRVRRGPIIAALGAAALAALVAIGVLVFLPSSTTSTPTVGQSSSGIPVASHTTAPPANAASGSGAGSGSGVGSGGPKIPASFAGKWSGTAMQSALADPQLLQLPNSITLTLAAGGRTAHEENQSCVNTLTLTKATATVLTFDEPGVAGSCVGGTVTLQRKGNGLTYRWTDGVEQNAGNLYKS